jgi:ABC-type uncharacterized transport system substrate-binding protein
VTRPSEFAVAFTSLEPDRPDGLVVYVTPITQRHRGEIVAFAASQGRPSMYSAREVVAASGLMSYGPNHSDLFRRAAEYVGSAYSQPQDRETSETGLYREPDPARGNITGLADVSLELMPKRLELFKELVPGATRVAVLVLPGFFAPDVIQGVLDDSKRASHTLGLRLETFEVRTSDDFDAVFTRIRQWRAEGLTFIPSPIFFHHRAQIAALAIKHRLAFVTEMRLLAEAGALVAYDHNLRQMWRQVAMYVDRILRGAKPADLPVQEPSKFDLVINLKTAKAIGLAIPPSLLQRADQVIE